MTIGLAEAALREEAPDVVRDREGLVGRGARVTFRTILPEAVDEDLDMALFGNSTGGNS